MSPSYVLSLKPKTNGRTSSMKFGGIPAAVSATRHIFSRARTVVIRLQLK